MSEAIGPDSRVVIHYRLTLADGTVVDSTEEQAPLTFAMGDGTLVEGLERTLHGLQAGDERHVHLEPGEAFGYPDTDNVHEMERGAFPPDMELEPGLIVGFSTPSGEEIPGTILSVGDDTVRVDFNHPLAGHAIEFEVRVVGVE